MTRLSRIDPNDFSHPSSGLLSAPRADTPPTATGGHLAGSAPWPGVETATGLAPGVVVTGTPRQLRSPLQLRCLQTRLLLPNLGVTRAHTLWTFPSPSFSPRSRKARSTSWRHHRNHPQHHHHHLRIREKARGEGRMEGRKTSLTSTFKTRER